MAKKERITIEEIYAPAREKGISSLNDLDAVVLETTGGIAVIPRTGLQIKTGTLKDVKNHT